MKLIYKLSDKKFLSLGTHDTPADGQSLIEITNDTQIKKIQAGYTVEIDNDLKLTLTKPPATKVETVRDAIDLSGVTKASDLSDSQVKELLYLYALEGGLTT